MMAASNSAATSTSRGSCPPQASLSRSAPASHTSRATSARQVSTLMTTPGCCSRTHATDLLGRVDLLAVPRPDPADVDDLRALLDDPVHPFLRRPVVVRRPLVVE